MFSFPQPPDYAFLRAAAFRAVPCKYGVLCRRKRCRFYHAQPPSSFAMAHPSSDSVDVSGLDTHTLLRRLWQRAKPASFFETQDSKMRGFVPPDWDDLVAASNLEISLRHGTMVGFLLGRNIWIDFRGKVEQHSGERRRLLDPSIYDAEYGDGAVAGIVAQLRDDNIDKGMLS